MYNYRKNTINPRPNGPLDFPPPDGGGGLRPPPLVTRLLDVVARNRKVRWTARLKALRKYFGKFFDKVNIEVTRGNQMSNMAKFHIFWKYTIISESTLLRSARKRNIRLLLRYSFVTCHHI